MDSLLIKGGNRLNGSLFIPTAKNSILPIVAGSLISGKKTYIKKIVKYSDVLCMIDILKDLGAFVEFDGDNLFIDTSVACKYVLDEILSKKIRASIFFMGALLSRFRVAKVYYPGGCDIGKRPIDIHIKGLKSLNVKIKEFDDYIYCDGKNMRSGDVYFDFPSVGATENIIMASVKLKGITTIYNSAKEPEIVDLQNFLNSFGCRISGAGTSIIKVEGVDCFTNCEYMPICDRIVAGTYMIASVMCGGEVELKGNFMKYNNSLIKMLKESGVKIDCDDKMISMSSVGMYKSIKKIETGAYPKFPTDLQNQMIAMQSIACGTSEIYENIFENRFKVCNELNKMGADIICIDNVATVNGVSKLYGTSVNAYDLRGGASLVLAGLVANGYTDVNNIFYIDRGYLNIENDLSMLGADIKRINK